MTPDTQAEPSPETFEQFIGGLTEFLRLFIGGRILNLAQEIVIVGVESGRGATASLMASLRLYRDENSGE